MNALSLISVLQSVVQTKDRELAEAQQQLRQKVNYSVQIQERIKGRSAKLLRLSFSVQVCLSIFGTACAKAEGQ